MRTIGKISEDYSWVLRRFPDYSELSKTSIASIAEIITQLSIPGNGWAADKFALEKKWNLFHF